MLAAAAASATTAAISRLARTPCRKLARPASSAPKTATATAPPICRHSPVFDSPVSGDPRRPANLARFIFLDEQSAQFYRDRDGIARQAVGSLHAEAGRAPHDRALTRLVGELSVRSQEFRELWAAHDVEYYRSGVQPFRHPLAGDLDLDYDALEIPADPGQTIIAYSAEPGSAARDALDILASWAVTHHQTGQLDTTDHAGRRAPK